MKIGFIGAGLLGSALALALDARGYSVAGTHSRRMDSAQRLAGRIDGCRAYETAQDLSGAADLVFITTPDRLIAPVAGSIDWRHGQGAVHCCGGASVELLESASEEGALAGALHPCQTFADVNDAAQAVERFKGVAFAVSAEGWLLEFLQGVTRDLGGAPVHVPDEHRALYHAASVLSCGHLASLLKGAVDIWESMGLDREEAARALGLLARTTLDNAARRGLEASITGPVARADGETVLAHLEALSGFSPDLAQAYAALGRLSLPIAESRGADGEALASMGKLFDACIQQTSEERG